jgi:hypothetical protein
MSLLSMTRGDKQAFEIAIVDADDVAVDLTGITITFTAKRRPTDADVDALIAKSTASGIAVDADPSLGTATITLDPEDTEDLTERQIGRSLYWDVQIDDLAGDVRTPLSGRLAIASDQTRASGAS